MQARRKRAGHFWQGCFGAVAMDEWTVYRLTGDALRAAAGVYTPPGPDY